MSSHNHVGDIEGGGGEGHAVLPHPTEEHVRPHAHGPLCGPTQRQVQVSPGFHLWPMKTFLFDYFIRDKIMFLYSHILCDW